MRRNPPVPCNAGQRGIGGAAVESVRFEIFPGPCEEFAGCQRSGVPEGVESGAKPANAATVLRRAGVPAIDDPAGVVRLYRLEALYDDPLFPVVPQVVDVAEQILLPVDEAQQLATRAAGSDLPRRVILIG